MIRSHEFHRQFLSFARLSHFFLKVFRYSYRLLLRNRIIKRRSVAVTKKWECWDIGEMKKYLLLAIVMGILASATPVLGATATNNLTVSATVATACQISSVANISFGAYDPFSATPNDASGNVVLRCVKGTSYKTYITGTRAMSGGGDTLNFGLYEDAGRSVTFPANNSAGGVTSTSIAPVTKNIYGRISAGQDVTVASYTATLVVTVEY
jgi:spore coat protein U-like protein